MHFLFTSSNNLTTLISSCRQITFLSFTAAIFLVEVKRVELLTPCLQSRCSSQLSYTPISNSSMVGLGRLELPTSRLSGVRSNHLSYKPVAAIYKIDA